MRRLTRSWWKKYLGRYMSLQMILMTKRSPMRSLSLIWMNWVKLMNILMNCIMQRRLPRREWRGMSNANTLRFCWFLIPSILDACITIENSMRASRIINCTCLSEQSISFCISYFRVSKLLYWLDSKSCFSENRAQQLKLLFLG